MPILVQCECGQKMSAKDEHGGKRIRCPKCGKESRIPTPSAYDVFISYSSKDKTTADALCATLEKNGLRCWIAPRDILPGSDWGEAIIGGIEQCRLMVLVYSSNSNDSPQVKREVERAVGKRLAIVPFRIENVPPSRSLEYFISSQHWLDALSPPLEKYLLVLADKLKHLLGDSRVPVAGPPSGQSPSVPSSTRRRQVWAWLAGAMGLAVAVGLLIWFVNRPGQEKSVAPPQVEPVPSSAAPVDLLRLVDVKRDRREGLWLSPKEGQLEGRALPFDKTPSFMLSLPWSPPAEYRFKVTVTRKNKEEGHLAIGLASGPGRYFVLFDGLPAKNKHVSGLFAEDRTRLRSSAWIGKVLPSGVPIPIVCTVRKDKVTVEARGRELFHYSGDLSMMSREDPYNAIPLVLHGAQRAVFLFDEIILEPLGPDAGKSLVEDKQ